uniref:cytochrome c oxidase subunit II n=1 Tax=Myxobolus honghuensis TaxID=1085956 RepID=UPI0030030088
MFIMFFNFLFNLYFFFNFFEMSNILFFYFSIFEFNYSSEFFYIYSSLLCFNLSICIFLIFFSLPFFKYVLGFYNYNLFYDSCFFFKFFDFNNFFMIGSFNYCINYFYFYKFVFKYFLYNGLFFKCNNYFFLDVISFIFYDFCSNEFFLFIPGIGFFEFSWVNFFLDSFDFMLVKDYSFILIIFGYQWSWDFVFFIFDLVIFDYFLCFKDGFTFFCYKYSLGCYFSIKDFGFNKIWVVPFLENILFKGYSFDVNHCFYLSNCGIKYDVFEERSFSFFFNFNILYVKFYYYFVCYEYCGKKHYDMYGFFFVLDGFWFNIIFKRECLVFGKFYKLF